MTRAALVVLMMTLLPTAAEARIDRAGWLRLYDSPHNVAKGAAALYVYGWRKGSR